MKSLFFLLGILSALAGSSSGLLWAQSIELELRSQQPTAADSNRFHRLTRDEQWVPAQTAVIVCDMWDAHHCLNAVRRVTQLAPRMNAFCELLRDQGVTIIHAPSGCMDAYRNHPARLRIERVAAAKSQPDQIDDWCDQIPSEEVAAYPIDQSDGGEDDDPEQHQQWAERLAAIGRNPKAPWQQQTDVIRIDPQRDYISDSGSEIWSVLDANQIRNVILVGVHTNMCVLGRPFGLRRLAAAGKNVVLARDLTDTMYNPGAWPYANHFTGTDLIINHVERYVCPTITSDQVLGDQPFRFAGDQRTRLLMLIAEDEYETQRTLPAFAATHLSQHFSVDVAWGSDSERNEMVGVQQLAAADALLVSVRRRALPAADLALIRQFIAEGKPVIGIRTASHAFSLRGKEPPAGTAVWPTFDGDVFGGNYSNHFGNSLQTNVLPLADGAEHPILDATDVVAIKPAGSLYKVTPLAAGTRVLFSGQVDGNDAQPLAWTFVRNDGGRSFYTSLGHPGDFRQPEFQALLAAGIHWACGRPAESLDHINRQSKRYAAGGGKQRN
ncbi:ThuA domain-containing protein [Stieleria sp. TO1_6]|uniref:ThuA domain-containing protein n=1 Tax=Stieleria tagensis TaxID=2956795 RepID=UPI00209B44A6|nr:ThuA domain-containing protein [Stieleria tagensis]MCO8122135.1 ThuA domain-containing protein [Stieleria tagensis]